MAALFCDGFDHYTAVADIAAKWTSTVPSTVINATGGRRGGGALKSDNGSRVRVTLTAPSPTGATVIFGQAVGWAGGPPTTFAGIALASTAHCSIGVNSNGTLSVYRGNGSVLLGTTVFALQIGIYSYVEAKFLLHASAGTVEIHVNGMNWPLNGVPILTGVNTMGGASATFDEFFLQASSGHFNFFHDDVYVLDGSGTDNNDFLGDVRADVIYPTAAGASSQFTRSAGTDQWATIDETTPNSDTDYNESNTPTHRDSLNFPNAPVTGAVIKFIQALAYAKKTDAGGAGLKLTTRLGGTYYDGTEQGLSTGYHYQRQIWGVKPSNGAAWVDTDINAAEFGYLKST